MIFLVILIKTAVYSNFLFQTNQVSNEDFNGFLNKFYNDSVFQHSRIVKPLAGKLKYWDESDSLQIVTSDWSDSKNELTKISSYETIKATFPKAKQSFEKIGNLTIEKIFLENSGFLLERKFKMIKGKWFLREYNVTYL